MNNTAKTISFIGGGVAIAIISALATLGIQKIYSTPPQPTVAAATPAPVPVIPTARVIAVTSHFEKVKKPIQRCYPKQEMVYPQPDPQPAIAGTLMGGLTGGLLGSTVHGPNRGLAIGGGAVLGAVAGSMIEQNMQQPMPQIQYSSHCVTRFVTKEVQKGYDVTYLYNDQQGVITMNNPPLLNSFITLPVSTQPRSAP